MHGMFLLLFLLPRPSDVDAALERASGGNHWYESRNDCPDGVRFGMWVQGAWVGLWKDKILLHAIGPERCDIAEVELRFEGANASEPVGMGLEPGVHHLYLGNDPAKWVKGLRTFASVRLERLYEGIDLEIGQREGHLEYDMYLEGGADLSKVVVSVHGASGVRLEEGELVLDTPAGELRQLRPVSWQVTPEGRQAIEVRYRPIDATRFGFEAPKRDPTLPLVIDPELTWSTYWGGVQTSGSIGDSANDVVLDEDGYLYVAGTVEGVGSLMTPGTYQSFLGLDDIFVAKLEQATGKVVYSARIGSSGIDKGAALDVDKLGRVTVVGWAGQGANNFPTTPGSFDPTKTSTNDSAVVFRLSSDGSTLQYSTYLESDLGCRARAVEVAASGSAIVAGEALGDNFPTTPGAFNPEGQFGPDAFVTRLNPTGSSLEWSTYVASADFTDVPLDMVLDGHEQVVIAGYSALDWPVTTGAFQTQWAGQWDGFATKLSSDGSSLVWSTFLGGSGLDAVTGVDILLDGSIVLCGSAASQDFPVTPNAFQPVLAGGAGDEDAFVARLDATCSTLEYSTYLGGSDDDAAGGLDTDASGIVTVVGATSSADFPIVVGAFDETPISESAFLTHLRPDGTGPLYSTFLGDTFVDWANRTTSAPDALITLVGRTSPPYPTTPNAAFPNPIGGQADSFITTLELLLEGVQTTGTSVPGCLGPLNANATTMPLAGQPFGLYCSQAPPNAKGALITLQGETKSLKPVQSGPEGYVETSVGNLPNTPGKVLRYRYVFRNPPSCPGPTLISVSNWVVIQVQ